MDKLLPAEEVRQKTFSTIVTSTEEERQGWLGEVTRLVEDSRSVFSERQ